MSTHYGALAQSGLAALARGDAAAARSALSEVEAAGHGTSELRLRLAQACHLAGDAAGANAALDKVLAADRGDLLAI
ncbi:MAG: tetratricopeptide repeat protein, partial [Parvularculaceae bacterium]|nr:tetratricopeptide repeat protein [Parvularculaceae bacterium]